MNEKARRIRVALSKECKGDWQARYDKRKKKEPLSDEAIERAFDDRKSNVLIIGDDAYPENLTRCNYPPRVLYYYGDLSLLNSYYRLTCVGSRKPTLYQNDTCFSFIQKAEELRKNERTLVSGRAEGLDQAFRRGARKTNAPVIAVLGCGIDFCYPESSKDIYDYCKSGKGLILSEYPGDRPPKKDNFLFRNRLRAALSEVLFVGGASASRSGTKATVRYALDRNKEIRALPCNVTGDDLTNSIIREGADVVLSPRDIVDQRKDCYRKTRRKIS